MGAQFTIPLITVIPGQLIASVLWNNEFNNINTNFIPAGMDSYSDTDAQMQIQTAPFPGSVTSHASNLGGEIERIRFQIAAILGTTYWYNAPAASIATMQNSLVPIGGVIDFPSATAPNANYHLADGTAIDRVIYASLFTLIGVAFGPGDGSTSFNLPNYTDKMSIAAGNLYALAATGGAVSSTPSVSVTDPGHNHTQNSHTHTMGNHTHSTPAHQHQLDTGTSLTIGTPLNRITGGGASSTLIYAQGTGAGSANAVPSTTASGGSGTSGTPSTNTTDATTPTNNSNTTGITASLGSGIATLPPYLSMYKMIRVL